MKVRREDFRGADICKRQKAWFRLNGLDWQDFLKNGIDAEVLVQIPNSREQIARVIEQARKRNA